MDGPGGAGTADAAPGSGEPVLRVTLAFVAGVVVAVIAAVLLAAVSLWLLPMGAVAGAGVAGYLGRVGRVGGTLLGAVVMAALGAAALAVFWLVATADPPRTGGAGLGLIVGFLFLALFALFGVVLGGLGGLTGVVARRRRATADAAGGDTATPPASHRPQDRRDPGRPEPADDSADALVATSDVRPGVESSVTTVLVGSGLAVATCFVPFAPVAAGTAVGYLEAAGPKRGAVVAAGAGLAATVLVLGGLLLFALLPLNILRPFILEYFPQVTVLLGVYFAGLGAIGGAFGGSMAG